MPKRNLERIREILLHLETQDGEDDGRVWTRGDDFWSAADQYQIDLAKQAGFLEGDYETNGSVVTDLLRITFDGHDYLDAIRDEGIWNKTKQAVAETGGSATLEIVKSVAVGFLKTKIEKHTGIAL